MLSYFGAMPRSIRNLMYSQGSQPGLRLLRLPLGIGRLATLVEELSSGRGGVEVEIGRHAVGCSLEFLFADFVSEVDQVRV